MSTRYRFVGPVSYEYMIANLPEGISVGSGLSTRHRIGAGGELEGDFRYLTDGKNFLHFGISPRYLDRGSSVCGFTSYGDDIYVHGIISRLEEKYGVEIMSEHVENLIISQIVAEYDLDKQAGLDDLIDDIKSREASDLNNGGSELQIGFLIEKMGVELATKAVRKLNEILPSPRKGGEGEEELPKDVDKGGGIYKQCYQNCFKIAASNLGYQYAEGLALGIVPMPHVWLVDKEGYVIDPTWNEPGGDLLRRNH